MKSAPYIAGIGCVIGGAFSTYECHSDLEEKDLARKNYINALAEKPQNEQLILQTRREFNEANDELHDSTNKTIVMMIGVGITLGYYLYDLRNLRVSKPQQT